MKSINCFKDKSYIKQKQQEILELYKEVKANKETFGEIANKKNLKIEQLIEILQSDYLKKVVINYSFQKLECQNIALLKQRKQLEMHFYFQEHNVTFDQLAEQFHITENEVIYYFDYVIAKEFTQNDIQKNFQLNKERRQKALLTENVMLNKLEIKQIDDIIAAFQRKLTSNEIDSIFQDKNVSYIIQKKPQSLLYSIKILTIIKEYLINPYATTLELAKRYDIPEQSIIEKMKSNGLTELLSIEILAKLKIKTIINKASEEKIFHKTEELYDYLSICAEFLNQPKALLNEIESKYNTNLVSFNNNDRKKSLFISITKIIQSVQNRRLTDGKEISIYSYYMQNFVFLHDLETIFYMSQQEIKDYFISCKIDYKVIEKIEENRHQQLLKNVQKLFHFSQLLIRFQQIEPSMEKLNLELEIIEQIGEQNYCLAFEKQPKYLKPYLKKLMCSTQFTGLYLYQEAYEGKELRKLMDIKSSSVEYDLLYHPITTQLLDADIASYIKVKRELAKKIQKDINFQEYMDRKGKQFVKTAIINNKKVFE